MKQSGQKSIRKIQIMDRIQELSDLWDSIPDKDAALPVPAWHLAELKRRHAALEKNPERLLSLDEFVRRYEYSL